MFVNRREINNFWQLNIEKVEKYYGVKYVGDFPFPEGDGFRKEPAAIFWRPEHLRNVNFPEYMAIIGSRTTVYGTPLYYIANGDYITQFIFNGLQFADEVVYSRWEDDTAIFSNGAYITGGFTKREWNAGKGPYEAKLVRLQVQADSIVILPEKAKK